MYNQKILLVATLWIQHTTINEMSEEAIQLILHTTMYVLYQRCTLGLGHKYLLLTNTMISSKLR